MAGRPRSFDRDEALSSALDVFWTKGYADASLTDLTAAMGINAPSLYAAFGSKEGLFREAVHLYSEREV
jgi:AcrR family transcriptional regulator